MTTKQCSVVPQGRWVLVDKRMLKKVFEFDNIQKRNSFVCQLLSYEEARQCFADVSFKERSAVVEVHSTNAQYLTEVDVEYCKFCDSLYTDVNVRPLFDF